MSDLAISATVSGSLDDVITRTTDVLASEGFGVLTRIDVHSTFKKKLDVEFRPYVILGACNPALAHAALGEMPEVGLFLPCNVTVEESAPEQFTVKFVNPESMMSPLSPAEGSELLTVAANAGAALARAAAKLA
jgi:uncharacterized protein (DUF302 family)